MKIADFGIAKALDSVDTALTVTGTTIGTPAYMAPEQALARPIGPWTDLYSLGVVAFELIAGRPPFDDAEPVSLLLRHVKDAPPPLTRAAPSTAAGPRRLGRRAAREGARGPARVGGRGLGGARGDRARPRWARAGGATRSCRLGAAAAGAAPPAFDARSRRRDGGRRRSLRRGPAGCPCTAATSRAGRAAPPRGASGGRLRCCVRVGGRRAADGRRATGLPVAAGCRRRSGDAARAGPATPSRRRGRPPPAPRRPRDAAPAPTRASATRGPTIPATTSQTGWSRERDGGRRRAAREAGARLALADPAHRARCCC